MPKFLSHRLGFRPLRSVLDMICRVIRAAHPFYSAGYHFDRLPCLHLLWKKDCPDLPGKILIGGFGSEGSLDQLCKSSVNSLAAYRLSLGAEFASESVLVCQVTEQLFVFDECIGVGAVFRSGDQ
jgi:hypothetical protein